MASRSEKRKFLTLEERAKVIEEAKSMSCRKIALKYGVGKTQIQSILKNKAQILEKYSSGHHLLATKKLNKKSTAGYDELNQLVYEWFLDCLRRKLPMSGPLIQEKALHFAGDLGHTDFKASNGWLQSFISRNNIQYKAISGERGDVPVHLVEDFRQRLATICSGFKPEDIFNMDETSLFYRDIASKKSFAVRGEDHAGGKRAKDRITMAFCASMKGKMTQLYLWFVL